MLRGLQLFPEQASTLASQTDGLLFFLLAVTAFFTILIAGSIIVFMPGDDPGGIIVTILLGIAGAVVGGLLGRVIGLYQEGQPAGFVMSVIGALVLLFGYRLLTRQRA